MKEVLAKQQELGFEAAEVPRHYLDGSKNHNYSSGDRAQNRFNNKRGRHEGRGRFHDRRDFCSHRDNSRNICHVKPREPTLLKKLLSAEIKADNHRILHAFKFMILNSFFNEWPDKQLEFPHVMVKEAGMDSEITEGNEKEMRELEGKSGLIERVKSESSEKESKSEMGEEKASESIMRETEKNKEAEKPEEGEITD
jgi:cleavage and polyadenylation specificity factor subunit 4